MRRRRERGFSLITVFLLMVVMTGTAIGVLVASQSDVNLSGVGREQQMALYAAEYAIARGKGFLASETNPMFNPAYGWNGLLTTTFPEIQAHLCQGTQTAPLAMTPGILPIGYPTTQTLLYTIADRLGNPLPGTAGQVTYAYCFHNNADDPGFLAPQSVGVYDGNVNDARDPWHFLTIEGYGNAPNNAQSHITVTVGAPVLNNTGGVSSYSQEGAGGSHTGQGGATETGLTVTTSVAAVYK